MTVWTGLVLGLLLFQAMRPPNLAAPVDVPVAVQPPADPYSESRRSRAILEAQEGGLSPRPASTIGNGERGSGGARVIDGDTFDHGGERIRIADIDAPEVEARCIEEARLAAAATRRLGDLLAAGPFELVPAGRDEDRHGRKLRIVLRDGRSIGDMLVAEGLARTWTGRREPWCA